ncbi:MAG: hypothetical protein E6Q78_06130 [Rhodoferax sp.]|nr:MAG: hypothetical protein E6Q78_06130 [Rhodoferax sp.]
MDRIGWRTKGYRRLAALGLGLIAFNGHCAEGGEDLGLSLDAGVMYEDNVTRGKLDSDKLADSAHTLSVGKAVTFWLAPNYRMVVNAGVGAQSFQTYTKLGNVNVGIDGELQYRPDAGFFAPTLSVFGKAGYEDYGSFARDGARYAVGLSIRQLLTDRISAFAALTAHTRRAQSAVFTTGEGSLRFNLDYMRSDRQTVYLGVEFRQGDIVSTGKSSLENVTIAQVLVSDDAFEGKNYFSYRMPGKTALVNIGYNHALGPQSAWDVSWRYIEATPDARPSWATSPRSYVSNQVFANFLYRF